MAALNVRGFSLESVCRLCLSSDSNNVHIFSEAGHRHAFQNKIWKHFSFWVHPEDALPKALCQLCCCQLENYHTFALKVEEVQRSIMDMVSAGNCGGGNYRPIINEYSHQKLSNSNLKSIDQTNLFHTLETSVLVNGTDTSHQNNDRLCQNQQLTHQVQIQQTQQTLATHGYYGDALQVQNPAPFPEQPPIMPCPSLEPVPPISCVNVSSVKIKVEVDPNQVNCETGKSKIISRNLESNQYQDITRNSSIDNLSKENSYKDNTPLRTNKSSKSRFKKKYKGSKRNSWSDEEDSEDDDMDMDLSESPEPRKTKLSEQLSKFYKYNCSECDKECSSYPQLDKHYRKLHNGKAYVTCCNEKLAGRMKLIGHMLEHIQPGMYKCPECGKQMANEANLSKHALRHLPNKDRPFKCLTCGKVFASHQDLVIHEKFHLPEAQRESCLCDYCGKKFSNPANLIAHQRYVHLQQRRAICHICARTYPNQSTLKAHMYTHNSKDSLQCPECGKWLKSILTLRTHMKCHQSELFPCPKCGKVFNYPQSLRHHLRSQHSDQRPHQCHMCSKTFKLKKTLKSHLNQHTGEKPYQCPHCPKNFANSGNFYTHKKRMHADQEGSYSKQVKLGYPVQVQPKRNDPNMFLTPPNLILNHSNLNYTPLK